MSVIYCSWNFKITNERDCPGKVLNLRYMIISGATLKHESKQNQKANRTLNKWKIQIELFYGKCFKCISLRLNFLYHLFLLLMLSCSNRFRFSLTRSWMIIFLLSSYSVIICCKFVFSFLRIYSCHVLYYNSFRA